MGGGKKESSQNVDHLGQMARALFNETSALRKEYQGQSLEALKTGGIGAQIPIIARALEASKSAASQSRQQTVDSLSRSNLAGTPFGQAILAQQEIQGNQHTADIPTQYAQSFISQIPSFITALTGQGIQGQQGAAQNEVSLYNSYNQGVSSFNNMLGGKVFDFGTQAIMGAMGGAMGGGGMTGAIKGMSGKL